MVVLREVTPALSRAHLAGDQLDVTAMNEPHQLSLLLETLQTIVNTRL